MSKLSEQIESYLLTYLKKFNLDLKKEVDAGFNSRYDFYVPTSPPIAIEVDGVQHKQFNSFFFKSVEDFQKYKNNDKLKDYNSQCGKIPLIRIEEDLTYDEFKKIISEYDYIFKKGHSEVYEDNKTRKKLYESRKKASQEEYKKNRNQKKAKRFQIIDEREENKIERNKQPTIRNFKNSDNKGNKEQSKTTVSKRFKIE